MATSAAADVDPRNGGDVARTRQLLDGLGVRVYAEVETPGPGDGRHFFVAGHPELASAHNLIGWPGIDIQSFGSLLFLPGTQRPKYNGAGYKIIFDNLEALADGGDPDGAAALAGWVAERRGSREEFEPSPPWDGKLFDQWQSAYVDSMLRRMHGEVAAMPKDSGRNTAVYNKALAVGNYVAGAGLNEDYAIKILLDACNHNGLINEDGERAVLASIHSGIRNGKTRPRAVPPRPPDDEPPIDGESADGDHRRIVLTRASDIKPRRVEWLWDARIPIGTLALLAGREGLGKSILAYTLAALITRGTLPGEHGAPKSVLVAATEDSWSQTIVPRLIAAGADLNRVYRVEVIADEVHTELTLPRDLVKMRNIAREVDAVLLILDPLLSRLDDRLDTHKDADVRRALEPLVAAADMINLAVLGLIHHNKSGSSDPLQVIMGSKAFAAVARSVHTVIYDPDDESNSRRLLGTPKNNLGRSDLPTFSFTIEPFAVAIDDDGNDLAWTGRLVWGEGSTHSIHDAMERAAETGEQRSAASDAQHWLEDYLTMNGGVAESAKIKKAASAAGHTERSRGRLKVEISEHGYPRQTWWSLPRAH